VNRGQRPLLAVVSVFVVAGVVALAAVDRSSPLDRTIARFGDEGRFSSGGRAARTIADISTQLRVQGTRCRDDKRPDARCLAMLSAAAFMAVSAVNLVDCSPADVRDARLALERYLRSLREFISDGAKGAGPKLPKVTSC